MRCPALLLSLLCSSLLQASSPQPEKDSEDWTIPLMMMRGEKPEHHENALDDKIGQTSGDHEEHLRCISEGSNDSSSVQSRGDLSEQGIREENAAALYQQVPIAVSSADDPEREQRERYLSNAEEARQHENLEAQKEKPQQEVINRFADAAAFHQQAFDTLNNTDHPDKQRQANYLNHTGEALFSIALEVQKEQPQQEVINRLMTAATFYQQALDTLNNTDDADRQRRANYLHNRGTIFYSLAQESLRQNPRTQVIDYCHRIDALTQQAITALNNANDQYRESRAIYLGNAAYFLYKSAKEAIKEQPNENMIEELSKRSQNWKIKAETVSLTGTCTVS